VSSVIPTVLRRVGTLDLVHRAVEEERVYATNKARFGHEGLVEAAGPLRRSIGVRLGMVLKAPGLFLKGPPVTISL
jgi:hypothetical protein